MNNNTMKNNSYITTIIITITRRFFRVCVRAAAAWTVSQANSNLSYVVSHWTCHVVFFRSSRKLSVCRCVLTFFCLESFTLWQFWKSFLSLLYLGLCVMHHRSLYFKVVTPCFMLINFVGIEINQTEPEYSYYFWLLRIQKEVIFVRINKFSIDSQW